jgi:hypothetical protein
VRLDRDLGWNEIAGAIEEAYATIAPRRLVEQAIAEKNRASARP